MIPPSGGEIARLTAALAHVGTPEEAGPILDAAGRLADEVLAPLDAVADRQGCRIDGGRVTTPEGYGAAWRAVAEGGWLGLDLPERYGGAALPLRLKACVGTLFDRACPAFGMAVGATQSAAVLLSEHAPPEVADDWIPALAAGARAATIAISEPDAGSDVGRMRTRATPDGRSWRIDGAKTWISFGDHDLTPRIGHCLLARTGDQPGARGLSLFLVPNRTEDGAPNGVTVTRLEEKLGLHGSPTCALQFEGARGILLGSPERGLPQLFTMIGLMRLQVGCQGLAAAARATEIAEAYAAERRQGGAADAPPVPIARHPDVDRQLRAMRGRTEVLRAAVLALAAEMEAGSPLAAFLLPLVKAHGSEIGFEVANGGIQVLGGAGYTCDWPLEQTLRDIRVAAIYEGTTGMQGIDLLERRILRDPAGFQAFAALATGPVGQGFARLARDVAAAPQPARLAAADDVLRAAWLAVTEWLAPRLDGTPAPGQLAERHAVHDAAARAAIA